MRNLRPYRTFRLASSEARLHSRKEASTDRRLARPSKAAVTATPAAIDAALAAALRASRDSCAGRVAVHSRPTLVTTRASHSVRNANSTWRLSLARIAGRKMRASDWTRVFARSALLARHNRADRPSLLPERESSVDACRRLAAAVETGKYEVTSVHVGGTFCVFDI